jgi:hypothetical protein
MDEVLKQELTQEVAQATEALGEKIAQDESAFRILRVH